MANFGVNANVRIILSPSLLLLVVRASIPEICYNILLIKVILKKVKIHETSYYQRITKPRNLQNMNKIVKVV